MPNDPDDESGRRSGGSGSGAGSGGPGGGNPEMPGDFPFGDPQQMAQMLRQFADMMAAAPAPGSAGTGDSGSGINWDKIGRASCREREERAVSGDTSKKRRCQTDKRG